MSTFVKKVFLKEAHNSDGVYGLADRCPSTPYGIKVDNNGCPIPITTPQMIELQVEFNFNKYFVRSEYHQELESFANFMRSFPALSVTLAGHTDNIGSKPYNQELSQKRAASGIDGYMQLCLPNSLTDYKSLSQAGAVVAYDAVMSKYKTLAVWSRCKKGGYDYSGSLDRSLTALFDYLAKEESAIRHDLVK